MKTYTVPLLLLALVTVGCGDDDDSNTNNVNANLNANTNANTNDNTTCVGEAPLAALQEGVCNGALKVCDGDSLEWVEPDYSTLSDYQSVERRCDGLDNDCDGVVDAGDCQPNASCADQGQTTEVHCQCHEGYYESTQTPGLCTADDPVLDWVVGAGGPAVDMSYDLGVDGNDNVIVGGAFTSSTTYGATTLTSGGGYDAVVAKFDPSGALAWVAQGTGSSYVEVYRIAVDVAGNTTVGGYFMQTANFGTHDVNTVGGNDLFVARLDPDGNWLWAQSAGSASHEAVNGITVDATGNVYVTGYTLGGITFGTTTLPFAGDRDLFVAKLDPDGNWLWAAGAGGIGQDGGYDLVVDDAGVTVVGGFADTVAFGSTTLVSAGDMDVFIARLDPDGNWLWAERAGGADADVASAVVRDSQSNQILGGYFSGSATFGTETLTSQGDSDIFVVKMDSGGSVQWAFSGGGSATDHLFGVTVDPSDNVLVSGRFQDTADLGGSTITSAGDYDAFLAAINPDGVCLWALADGGAGYDSASRVALDSTGNLYLNGVFNGTATFDTVALTAAAGGDNDAFILKYLR